MLSAGILFGSVLGAFIDVSAASVTFVLAFLAGAVVLNVLKDELPEERQGRLLPLLGGMVGYSALLFVA